MWKPPVESPAFSYNDPQCGRDLYVSPNFSTTAKNNSVVFNNKNAVPGISSNPMFWPSRVESVTESFAPVNRSSRERRQGNGTGCRLFGIQLDNFNTDETSPVVTALGGVVHDRPALSLDTESDQHSEPSNANRSDVPSASCEPEKSCLRSPLELQSRQIRSCTKVISFSFNVVASG